MLDETDSVAQTVTDSGRPVKERVTTVTAARALFDTAERVDRPLAVRRARLKGQIDGNPPYNPERLKELGLSYTTNVNFLEMRSILDQKAGASFELLFEVPTLVEVSLSQVERNPQQPSEVWGTIVAEEFTRLLFNWPGFLVNMDRARREADAFDVGVMVWRDEWDFRPHAFSRGSFLPEKDAELDLDQLQYFCLRDRVTAGQLYRWALEDEEAARDVGWNPDEVKQVLIRVYRDKMQASGGSTEQYPVSEWESVQQGIRNGAWWAEAGEFDRVKIIHLLVRAVSSPKVSHYIFMADGSVSASGKGSPDSGEKFLFRQIDQFESMDQVLWLLPYNFADGYIASVRGLASSIEGHCDLSNRFLGRVFDAGMLTASILLQPESGSDYSKLQMVQVGPATFVPPGLNAVQSSFQPQLAPLIQLRDLSVAIMKNNSGVWKVNSEVFSERGPEKTARQVVEEVSRESRLEKINVAFEYSHVERLYREMFRRVMKPEYHTPPTRAVMRPGAEEARKFIDRCKMRGVPEEYIMRADAWDVRATRTIGMGSWGVKLDLSNQVLGIRGLLDEAGQRNALRDWLSVRVGPTNVDRYSSLVNRDRIPTNEVSIAALENNDLAEGSPVAVGSDQTHAMHAYKHIEPISAVVQAVVENRINELDLRKSINVLTGGLPHLSEHIQYLAQDPKRRDLVDELVKMVKSGQQILAFLQKVFESQQAQLQTAVAENQGMVEQAEQTLKDRDYALKLEKLRGDLALEHEKQVSLNNMRAQKTAEQMAINRERAAAEAELARERQAVELELRAREVEAKVAQAARQ